MNKLTTEQKVKCEEVLLDAGIHPDDVANFLESIEWYEVEELDAIREEVKK